MQQITSVWSALDTRRRVIVIAATLAMFAAVLALSRMASQPSMSLLYAGLEPQAAGEVVSALEAQGVPYDIRGNAIFVDGSARDGLRMTLASQGLPANGAQGYELLDSLSGFGTTSQMFDAAYWRAKEGELSRTIVASPRIKSARVHISNPSSNPFQRDMQASASVFVTPAGGSLPASNAKALKYLVASAVAGLSPDGVSVIDGTSGVVISDDSGPDAQGDRATELRRNIQRLLEARVGPGRAVVEVSVERVTEREAIVERRFDPASRVAISSETEERSTASSGTENGGAVTVASNLPEGDAAGESSSRSENSETRERVNYEVSETTREVLRTPGAVKRISVAVLVDGLRRVDPASGTATWQPRPDEEIEALRDLVASAVGYDAERGDTITLKSMEFEPVAGGEPIPAPGPFDTLTIDTMALIQLAILGVVALALGLFVIRPILRPRPVPAALAAPADAGLPVAAADGLASAATAPPAALTGEIEDGDLPMPEMAVVSADARAPNDPAALPADPVDRLRQLIEDRRDETVEILRSWMEEPAEQEEKA